MKQVVLSTLRKCRFEYLPDWRRESFCLGQHLRELFRRIGVDCVIDVGANRGQYVEFLRKEVGFTGRVHSFEPDPDLAAALRIASAQDSNWHVHEVAVGDADGSAVLNIAKSTELNSLLQPVADADLPSRIFIGQTETVRSVTVRMARLDGILDEILGGGPEPTLYIKVDTQGFDIPVLRGATSWLRRAAAVQTELSFQSLYEGAPTYRESMVVLEELGYRLSGLFPVVTSSNMSLIEADGVFVRTALHADEAISGSHIGDDGGRR